jgi:SAM-dependent methyltransferase
MSLPPSGSHAELEQLPAHLGSYNLVFHHRLMLAAKGMYLTPRSRILDFGCGSGRYVYDYRDAGFDAYGFDIASSVELRDASDEAFFRFGLSGVPGNVPDYEVDEQSYRVAFDDDSFDFVFSNSVFEHVQNHDLALREIARVLRPGGLAIHTFPARYCLIEPHMFVPLGGIFTSVAWYRLWALLGIRNAYQRGMSARDVALANRGYAESGINYVPVPRLLQLASANFREAILAPALWTVGSFRHPLVRIPVVGWIYSRMGTVVLWLRR